MSSELEQLPFVWSDACLKHEPGGEVWVGVKTPGTELAERAVRIRAALAGAGAREVEAEPHPDRLLETIHDPALLEYLARAWSDWQAAGLELDPGQNRVVPYLFPHPGLTGGIEPTEPPAVSARAGLFCFDTMTLVGPGTWEAARAAIDVALTAADLVAGGEPVAYACTRPPGHHAARSVFGGSCYLNNAAVAAAGLHESIGKPVAIVDIDAHHGNGSQQIFYGDPAVLTGSVHVDPGAGWFPHFVGFASEQGTGAGRGGNRNLPLAPGTGDPGWLTAVEGLIGWALDGKPRAIVLALGVDAAASDPESPFDVTASAYRRAGELIGESGLPVVVVQEGGYDLETIGRLVLETLCGIREGQGR